MGSSNCVNDIDFLQCKLDYGSGCPQCIKIIELDVDTSECEERFCEWCYQKRRIRIIGAGLDLAVTKLEIKETTNHVDGSYISYKWLPDYVLEITTYSRLTFAYSVKYTVLDCNGKESICYSEYKDVRGRNVYAGPGVSLHCYLPRVLSVDSVDKLKCYFPRVKSYSSPGQLNCSCRSNYCGCPCKYQEEPCE